MQKHYSYFSIMEFKPWKKINKLALVLFQIKLLLVLLVTKFTPVGEYKKYDTQLELVFTFMG